MHARAFNNINCNRAWSECHQGFGGACSYDELYRCTVTVYGLQSRRGQLCKSNNSLNDDRIWSKYHQCFIPVEVVFSDHCLCK